jgi:DNA polymerase III epsilon subunit-like protein
MSQRGRKKQNIKPKTLDRIDPVQLKMITTEMQKRISAIPCNIYDSTHIVIIFQKVLDQCVHKPYTNNNNLFLIFDFETDANFERNFMHQRPIQLAWQICDSYGNIISKKNVFINECKNLGCFWFDKKYYTIDLINKYGKDIKHVLLSFIEQLKIIYLTNGFIVGHNVSFDFGVLKYAVNNLLDLKPNDIRKYDKMIELIKTRRICTMHKTRRWYGTQQIESFLDKGKIKLQATSPPVKLSELYNKLCPDHSQDELNYHHAEFDVEITKRCLIKYLSVTNESPHDIIKTNDKKNVDINIFHNTKSDTVSIKNNAITYKKNVTYPTIKNSVNNRIQCIILKNCTHIDDVSLNIIGQSCTNLRTLDLENCHLISNLGIYFVRNLNLQYLNLNNCYKISGRCIQYLKHMPIHKLYLRNCRKITNNDIRQLKHLPLTELDISGLNINISKLRKYVDDINIINKTIKNDGYYSDSDVEMNNIDDKESVPKITYVLPTASQKQSDVVSAIKTHNVQINSVAGSGKTTTILHIASQYKNMKILVLTYNKKLKIDSRAKVTALKLTNIEVHSYHSFCVKYYSNNCHTDFGLMAILHNNTKPTKKFKYDLIIIDESQDINDIYYSIVCKIIHDNKFVLKLCVNGDICQTIYQYNDADPRYLLYANKAFDNNKWKTISFNESFRVTNRNARLKLKLDNEKIQTSNKNLQSSNKKLRQELDASKQSDSDDS